MSKPSRLPSKTALRQSVRSGKSNAVPAPGVPALLDCFAVVAPGLESLALADARADDIDDFRLGAKPRLDKLYAAGSKTPFAACTIFSQSATIFFCSKFPSPKIAT